MFKHPDILGFQGDFRFLSNFWPVEVMLGGITFPSVEHAYVAAKTTDVNARKVIAEISTSGKVKRYGRTLELRPDWDDIKLDVMQALLEQKFEQDPLRQKLLDTGNAYLEETNSWGDVFWGVYQGSGYNHLGNLLMQVRSNISLDLHTT